MTRLTLEFTLPSHITGAEARDALLDALRQAHQFIGGETFGAGWTGGGTPLGGFDNPGKGHVSWSVGSGASRTPSKDLLHRALTTLRDINNMVQGWEMDEDDETHEQIAEYAQADQIIAEAESAGLLEPLSLYQEAPEFGEHKMSRFWIVTTPSTRSTLADICFETDIAGLDRQLRGGLDVGKIEGMYAYEDEAAAHMDAKALLDEVRLNGGKLL